MRNLVWLFALVQLALTVQPDRYHEHQRRSRTPIWHHQRTNKHVRRADGDVPNHGKFLTEKTKQYAVNGSRIPDVDFDLGESYAGLLPISGSFNESRQLFFWFWPSIQPEPPKEIVIWLNGGPGCSSLLGLISENGPFTWMSGTYKPVQNAFDWRNLTNVLWVEQPVGVGYNKGNISIINELGLAEQFVGFYEQFIKTFDVQGWDLYLNGESYAGKYIPYIANGFLTRNCSDMPLKGVAFNNPSLSDDATESSITQKDFYYSIHPLYGYNETTLVNLTARHIECGYDKYVEKYLTFPPPQEPFPILDTPFSDNDWIEKCDTFSLMLFASQWINPCFNQYRITDHCPIPWSVLGPVNEGDYDPAPKTRYFNRTDVQKAINAPIGAAWISCNVDPVFIPNDNHTNRFAADQSPPVAQTDVLTKVIEATNNVIIGTSNLDARIVSNGTLLALQNITWNGLQGFQKFPGDRPFFVPYHVNGWNRGSMAGQGVLGSWGEERGLTFYQVKFAGHMVPGDAPGAGYRVMEKLLGRIDNLAQTGTFTTQKDVVNASMWIGGFLYKEDEGPPPLDPFEVEKKVRDENITLFGRGGS